MRISLRPVVAEDEPFLLALYASTREEELALTGWDQATRSAFVQYQYQAQKTHYGAHYPGAEHSILMEEHRCVGQQWVWRSTDEIRLMDVTVAASHRGRGLGTRVMKQLLEEGRVSKRRVTLHVAKDNERVLRFYQRLGFTVVQDTGMHLCMEARPPAAS